MAVCTKCGGEMKQDAKFCKACGSGAQAGASQEQKKARVLAGETKSPKTAIIIAGAVALVVAGWLVYNNTSPARSLERPMQAPAGREGNKHLQYTAVTARNGDVTVPLGSLPGSTAGYFVYHAGGKDIRFFVLRAADGTVRAALDTCSACYHAKLGYRQKGDTMVCNNCGMSFRSTDVGHVSGGCSPIPLKNSQDGKALVVKAKDLEEGAKYF